MISIFFISSTPRGHKVENFRVAIAGLPDEPIVNYYFHHHLGINLLNKSVWLEEVAAPFVWHPRHTQAQVAFNECLELALP